MKKFSFILIVTILIILGVELYSSPFNCNISWFFKEHQPIILIAPTNEKDPAIQKKLLEQFTEIGEGLFKKTKISRK